MHSELSEALEEWRKPSQSVDMVYCDVPSGARIPWGDQGDELPLAKPEGFPVELADCLIRILDTCAALNIDISEAVELKMQYNKTRPFRHGGKKA